MSSKRPAVALSLCVLVATAARSPAVQAYDPATTHAGLTEQAVLASRLHQVLSRRFGRGLGILEPLQIHSRLLAPETRRSIWSRIDALDPSGGYRPSPDGVATALSWVVAGAVLAETPPERGQNHFFDPSTGRGLDDAVGLAGVTHALRLAADDAATFRQLATGTAFTLRGKPALAWAKATENEQGLPAFHDQLERAVGAADPAEREAATVRALLALGGILAVLQDMGEPAHVRNDFREAFLDKRSQSSWDRASAFERHVAGRYGRGGVPAPAKPVVRPSFEAYFSGGDGNGLADRTQRRFFSAGTVPAEATVRGETTTKDVLRTANESLVYAAPAVAALELKEIGRRRYVMIDGRKGLAYERSPAKVRFFQDEAVHADVARALLPEIGAYTAGLVDHLLRGELDVVVSGTEASIVLATPGAQLAEGTLRVFAEDAAGVRREIGRPAISGLAAGGRVTVAVPAGAKRVAAVLRGRDAAGPLVSAGESSAP